MRDGVVTTLGYLISRESHHRGSIALALKQCGHSLDASTRAALWGGWSRAQE